MKILTILLGIAVFTVIVLNLTVSFKPYEANSLSVKLLTIIPVALGEDPQPIEDMEDQYCKQGPVGCCESPGSTCETGIKCAVGGCG